MKTGNSIGEGVEEDGILPVFPGGVPRALLRGALGVVLADGEIDSYREGIDATDGSIVTNCGNYGVVYRLEVPVRATTHFFMSPMGGGYAGVVRANAGKDAKRLIAVPDNRLMFGENSVHPQFDISGSTMLLPSAELADLGVWKKKPQQP